MSNGTERFVFGVWHGGNGHSDSDWRDDMESFPTITAARDALYARAHSGNWYAQDFDYVFREAGSFATPGVYADSGSRMDVVVIRSASRKRAIEMAGEMFEDGNVMRYEFGPRGAVRKAA